MLTHAYGPHPDQVADLHLPADAPPPAGWPVVVLLHGGFWRHRYARDLTTPLAIDLANHGIAAWNVEFRRVQGAGGWPMTFEDVAAAIDHLVGSERPSADLDPSRTTVLGHSAGGHLALWAAGRARLPEDVPGGAPQVSLSRAVALAPVADLLSADDAGLGDDAARDLLGGSPDEQPERWAVADPVRLVGHGVPTLLVHGLEDADVPVGSSRRYADAARAAGDPVDVVTPACGHMELIDPDHPSWEVTRRWIVEGA